MTQTVSVKLTDAEHCIRPITVVKMKDCQEHEFNYKVCQNGMAISISQSQLRELINWHHTNNDSH